MVGRRISLAIGLGVALCVVLSGCGASQEETPAIAETSAPSLPAEQSAERSAIATAPVDDAPAPPDAAAAAEPTAAVDFAPPFPDRVNLFQAPRRQSNGLARRGEQVSSTVELLGFVNVDGPRVVLAVDGLVAPIAEGDEQFGIEVISIQPPSVVLQRGRQRWQASLNN